MPDGPSARTISTRFWLIFWGLVLVIVNINIFGIDILPNFIGYILVAVGCAGLSSGFRHFSTASVLSWILTAVALIALMDYMMPDVVATGLELLSVAVECAMMWFLLGGVMEMAAARRHMDLSGRASQCRIAYVVLRCLAALAGAVGDPAVVMGVVVVVCIIALLILILHLLYRAKHELAGDLAV